METPPNPNIGAAREAKERVLALNIAGIAIGIGFNSDATGHNIQIRSNEPLQPDTAAQILTAAQPIDAVFKVIGNSEAQ